ncbi:bile acid:sodium symporter family protein [Marinobacterium lutimaris]|uniref:Bile acid:Na+ symporter, BASS family n=1 Tax=Marinobacterium lutimaris TaxID=568106 RepID=A0A1H5UKU9_9GAMM|nr:bile acid:sodium symporter [Marinobacterium lutimaris]SEF75058.1 bile acid:Na+ symporter, BASS family [Marinobacterium lutimaris]
MDVESLGKLLLPFALFLMMLGVGITLEWRDLARVFRQDGRVLLAGLTGQMLLLPCIGVILCLVLQLPPLVAAALMIVTLAPGGVTSNMITLVARGDTALSVALTAVGSLITPFTLPLLTALVLNYAALGMDLGAFPILPSIFKLATVTLLPVILGVCLRARFPAICQTLYPWVKGLAVLGFLAMVAVVVLANRERLPALMQSYAHVALLLSMLAMAAGAGLGWFLGAPGRVRLTLAVEVGIQNAGTALMVTGAMLGSAEMSAVVLIYGVVMQLPAALLMLYRNLPLRRAGAAAG